MGKLKVQGNIQRSNTMKAALVSFMLFGLTHCDNGSSKPPTDVTPQTSSEQPTQAPPQTPSMGTTAPEAALGPSVSGGGDAHVCFDGDGFETKNITSVELYDLYEGTHVYKRSYIEERRVDRSTQEWLKIFLNRVKPLAYGDFIVRLANEIYLGFDTSISRPLIEIRDENPIVAPGPNCKKLQLARYMFHKKILVSKILWKHLPNFDRAALVLHETFFSIDRRFRSSIESSYARYVTSHVADIDYSIKGIETTAIKIVGKCEGVRRLSPVLFSDPRKLQFSSTGAPFADLGKTLFYVVDSRPGRITLKFNALNGRILINPMHFEITDNTYEANNWISKIPESSGKIKGEIGELNALIGAEPITNEDVPGFGFLVFANSGEEETMFHIASLGDEINFKCRPFPPHAKGDE